MGMPSVLSPGTYRPSIDEGGSLELTHAIIIEDVLNFSLLFKERLSGESEPRQGLMNPPEGLV